MAFTSLASKEWGSGPVIDLDFAYDLRRSGADMQYKIKITVNTLRYSSSYFGYPIYTDIDLDSTTKVSKYTLKSASLSTWSSDIVYTSGWLTVSKKTSGTTALSIRIYSGLGNTRDTTYTFTLPVEPGASSISASDGTLDKAQTLTVTRYDDSFTHTITYTCGSASGTVVTKGSDTSINWTPPLSLASQNTVGTSIDIKLTITTYSGSTQVGDAASVSITATIPDKVKPSCSVVVTDVMGYKDTYGKFIKGLSKFEVVVTPAQAYASPIVAYATKANGSTYTEASFTTGVLRTSGTLAVEATVTDQRGRSGTGSASCSVYDYDAPAISSMSVKRCNADGTTNPSGPYLKVVFSATATSLDSQNKVTFTVKYKKSTASNYTSETLTNYANTYSVSSGTYIFAADASSYNVILTVEDAFYSGDSAATKSANGPATSKVWAMLSKGKGFAFGKIAELSGYLDIGWKSMFRDNVYLAYDKSIYGVNANGENRNVFKPFSSNGNTLVGYSNYENADANTNIYGNNINFFIAAAGNQNYKPYYCAGDSINVIYYGAGFLTSSKTQVRFTLPLSKPIIGSPKITVSDEEGFVLRQSENYTHGSAASNLVKPSSYTFAITDAGIRVVATFSDTTNAVNNDAIGIEWVATLALSQLPELE